MTGRYQVRWNLDSVTQPLHLLEHAIEVCLSLRAALPGSKPEVETTDGEPFSVVEVEQLRKAGI